MSMSAGARASAPTALQRLGFHPPGIAEGLRCRPEWEELRGQMYNRALRFKKALTFDFRQLLTDARIARLAGMLMWQLIRRFKPEVLVGPGFGATPLLYATALAALEDGVELKVLMVRDKRKDHNQKRWVEGDHQACAGRRAVFLDDFMKRGSAWPLVQKALAADQVQVHFVAIALFFDMWEPLGTRQLSVSALPLVSLYTRHDLGLSRDCYDAVPPLMKGRRADFIGEQPRWWRFELNRGLKYPLKTPPLLDSHGLYVVDEHATLWKHDLRTGDILWSLTANERPAKGAVQQIQAVDGSLVWGCYDGTLTRARADSGEVQWRWKLGSWIHASPVVDRAGKRLFISSEHQIDGVPCGYVHCLDLDTGRLRWRTRLGWWPPATPVLSPDAGIVAAACNDQTLTGLDAETGEQRWCVKTPGLVRGKPLAHGGRLWAATESGTLQCWDAATGATLWTTRYGQGQWHQFTAAANGEVFVVDGQSHLQAYDAQTGALSWLARLRSPACWGPVMHGSNLVVMSRDGHVAVLDPRQRLKLWEGQIPGVYHQPPAVRGHTLAAASSTSGLIVYDIDPSYES
jgi:outer membrane protein assembly factor BamB/orotate phosphoribosyltransferase